MNDEIVTDALVSDVIDECRRTRLVDQNVSIDVTAVGPTLLHKDGFVAVSESESRGYVVKWRTNSCKVILQSILEIFRQLKVSTLSLRCWTLTKSWHAKRGMMLKLLSVMIWLKERHIIG